MLNKRIADIVAGDIQGLIDNQVPEGKTIEYKEALPSDSDEKFEFLRDISAFANAVGGDIIYGVSEGRDSDGKPTGIPREIVGLPGANLDAEKLRLEQILRTGIEPKIPVIQMQAVEIGSGTKVLVIRVGDSWQRPHHICFKSSPRYYTRTSAGKQPLDYLEIRDAFIQSADLPKRLREFRDQRLATILSGDMLFELPGGPVIALHFLPLEAFRRQSLVELTPYIYGSRVFPTGIGIGGHQRPNLDGVIQYSVGGGEIGRHMYGFTQIFHSGAIEIVDGFTISSDENQIATVALEKSLYLALKSASNCLRDMGMNNYVYLFLSIMNVKGYRLYERGISSRAGLRKEVDRNNLLFPELQLDLAESFEIPHRKLCDQFWQACGASLSPHFDETGKWIG